jgi:hypothetical protein
MPSPEASRRNLENARARWRAPKPWRSADESLAIKRLVWQWFNSAEPAKWSGRAVARWLGVTHTYIQKLVREFATDGGKMQREALHYGLASFEQLFKAREATRQEKERGQLRPLRRWRVVEFRIGDQVVRTVVPTKASTRVVRVPDGVPRWATGLSYYSTENPCDPLVEVKYSSLLATEENRKVQPIPVLRRRRRRDSSASSVNAVPLSE